MTETLDRFDYVLTMLSNCLKRSETGVVFLLGAGCSCQYGLPSFHQLLTYIWEDCHGKPPKDTLMETLREKLDGHWHTLGPKGRRDILQRSLRRVNGKHCPGYRRLARLCHPSRSLKVRAIVNMNFDSLLEEALEAEGVTASVVASFAELEKKLQEQEKERKDELIICKPHGSLGKVEEKKPGGGWHKVEPELILDIANSEMFARRTGEQTAAQLLLASHDVVTLGYSGIDSKIATSLRYMPEDDMPEAGDDAKVKIDPRDKKLFFVSSSLPDSRLVVVMTERESQNLSISGEEAAFGNFMEQLENRIEGKASDSLDQILYRPADRFGYYTFMTRSERAALEKCLRLALRIRAAINVADSSEVGIEAHGASVYRSCLQLAEASGVCLSPPEKYVLYAVAFLHDLGYFEAYSDGTAIGNGWQLLDGGHGKRTADLLNRRNDELPDIVPATYGRPQEIIGIIKFVCRFHPYYEKKAIDDAIQSEKFPDPRAISTVEIGGCEVPIRVALLQALFAAAEELAEAHPWAPSADTLLSKEEENRWAIEDPVLDLYLRRKRNVVSLKIEGCLVIGSARPTGSKKADWLLAIVNEHIKYYEAVRTETYEKIEGEGGRYKEWQLTFRREPEVEQVETRHQGHELLACLLCEALEEELKISLQEVRFVFARDLEFLRKNGEEQLKELCRVLAGAGLRESAMHLRMVQRALTSISLPDLWYSELVRRLRQVRQDIIDPSKSGDPEPVIGIADPVFHNVRPLLTIMDADDGYGLVGYSETGGMDTSGREALDSIKMKLESFNRHSDSPDLLKLIGEVLDDLEAKKAGILEALGMSARSLLLSAAEVVRSIYIKGNENISEDIKKGLRDFSDQLSSLVSKLGVYFSGEIASVLDLIAIYTLSVSADPASRRRDPKFQQRAEPRVSLAESQVVGDALAAVARARKVSQFFPHQGLLQIYLPLRRERSESKSDAEPVDMEGLFLQSFDEIIYPAWRFFARSWHYGIEPVLMARICLDLGSSRFRSEVVNGLKFLMKRVETRGELLCGHDGCTLCTSRLLYIFSYGCKLFPRDELENIRVGVGGRNFDETVGSILKFMIDRDKEMPPDPSMGSLPPWREWKKGRSPKWKGSEKSVELSWTIQSSDYLAWAARAVAFCLSVDEEIRSKTGVSWLEDKCQVDLEECYALLDNRFEHLFEERSEDMLSRHGEEPHSFILGHIALAMLDLEMLSRSSERARAVNDRVPPVFKDNFKEAYREFEGLAGKDTRRERASEESNSTVGQKASDDKGEAALLSRLYSWPAGILYGKYLDKEREKEERDGNYKRMVELCRECVRSEIWIKEGSDAGSWGYNLKNSQTIITSLATFWRHVFDSEDREMYARLFKEEAPGAGSASIAVADPSRGGRSAQAGGRPRRGVARPKRKISPHE